MGGGRRTLVLVLGLLLASADARAQSEPDVEPSPDSPRVDGEEDAPREEHTELDPVALAWWPWVASVGAAGLGLGLDLGLPSADARWTGEGPVDHAFRALILDPASAREAAGRASDVLVIGNMLAPLLDATLWRQPTRDHARTAYRLLSADALVLSLNFLLFSATKVIAQRERPYSVSCETDPDYGPCESEDRFRSFYSGHSASAFAGAALVCAHQELRGHSPLGWFECGTSLAVATTVASLRMAASRHYFSDVLVGAIIGAALGYFIPVYVYPRRLPRRARAPSETASYW